VKKLVRRLIHRFGIDIMPRYGGEEDPYAEFPHESLEQRRFYNIGAGLFEHPYWTNVDYKTEYYSQYQNPNFINFNLMEDHPLPVADDSAELVYSSQTIEHLDDEAVRRLRREAHRILKPGGGLRITCPDMALEYRAYRRKDLQYWYWYWRHLQSRPGTWEGIYTKPLSEASIHQLFLAHFASQVAEIHRDADVGKKFGDEEIAQAFETLSMEEAFEAFTRHCTFNPHYPASHMNLVDPRQGPGDDARGGLQGALSLRLRPERLSTPAGCRPL
jgi:SAM-dependent methyltransferase